MGVSVVHKVGLNKVDFLKRHSPCFHGAYSLVENTAINTVYHVNKCKITMTEIRVIKDDIQSMRMCDKDRVNSEGSGKSSLRRQH